MPEDVVHMPKMYQTYHTTRIERIRNDPKRLVFDELHRVAKNSSVAEKVIKDLETAARESRKWNLHIGLYSQDPGDFPPVIAGFASVVFIFGVGTAKVAKQAGEVFSLDDVAVDACIRRLRKPNKAGSTAVAKFAVDGGAVTQFILTTLGPITLWALASTTEDTYVRRKLYIKLTPRVARDALSRLYPGGSIKDVYETLRLQILNHEPMGGDFDDLYAEMSRTVEVGEVVDARDLLVEHVARAYRARELRRIDA
jgi:intracellular multiplication protein IcmB